MYDIVSGNPNPVSRLNWVDQNFTGSHQCIMTFLGPLIPLVGPLVLIVGRQTTKMQVDQRPKDCAFSNLSLMTLAKRNMKIVDS